MRYFYSNPAFMCYTTLHPVLRPLNIKPVSRLALDTTFSTIVNSVYQNAPKQHSTIIWQNSNAPCLRAIHAHTKCIRPQTNSPRAYLILHLFQCDKCYKQKYVCVRKLTRNMAAITYKLWYFFQEYTLQRNDFPANTNKTKLWFELF